MNQYYASPDCLALGSKATVCGLQVGPRLADIGTTAAVVTLAGCHWQAAASILQANVGLGTCRSELFCICRKISCTRHCELMHRTGRKRRVSTAKTSMHFPVIRGA